MNQSIFGSLALRGGATPDRPRGREPVAASTSKPSWSASTDVALLAILHAPLSSDETVAAGFARKEAEFRRALATLSIAESRALYLRLSQPKAGDQLAATFTRLTADRRERLIHFIADARRRDALSSGGQYGK